MQKRPVRIDRHRSASAAWQMVRAQPDPGLRPYVRDYCGYSEQTKGPMRRRELPSVDVVLVLNLGEPLRLFDQRDGGTGDRVTSFVAGLSDTYTLTESEGMQFGVQVNFTPLGAQAFFGGLPMGEISNRAVGLSELLGARAASLTDRLHAATTWEARFDILDRAIAQRFEKATPPPKELWRAWRRLSDAHGSIPIEALARDVGWSRRHLAARFRHHVGLTPKVLGQILRFRRAVALLRQPDARPLAEIADVCGYYDQAHLNRDFRRFAGGPPTDFLTRMLPDGGGLSGA